LTREVPPVIGGFASKLLACEKPIIYGDGKKIREFVYINDLVELHYLAMKNRMSQKNCMTYNVGAGNPISIFDLYSLVWDICKNINDKIVDKNEIDWRPERDNEASYVVLNSCSTNSTFDWTCRYTLSGGILETIKRL